ncbi:MAG: nitroreductase family protein [Coriobacteriia bacterium]|nr:nitroreductase family protein [Coriobacteriia bacterium]MBN2821714.1 nitroreductase family protein [Coriobacteriia bacterium]
MVSRRGFIAAGLGTVGLIAVGGGLIKAAENGVFSVGEGAAFEAWNAPLDGIEGTAAAAVLAASSHNTQPWSFRVREDGIDVLGDMSRLMGLADARLRELHISLGCALENIAVAAAAQGLVANVEYIWRTKDHFARVTFVEGETDPQLASLAEQIPLRRTNRGAYDTERGIGAAELKALGDGLPGELDLQWLISADDRAWFGDLVVQATEEHVADVDVQRDSHAWYRMTRQEVDEYRDGITVDGAAAGVVGTTFLKLFPPTPDRFDEQWSKVTSDIHCATAPAYGFIVAPSVDDHRAWVQTGRVYQRMNLTATALGIAMHPLSQPLTIRDRDLAQGGRNEYANTLEEWAAGEVVLAFRVGYPLVDVTASPRRPLDAALA